MSRNLLKKKNKMYIIMKVNNILVKFCRIWQVGLRKAVEFSGGKRVLTDREQKHCRIW